MKNFANGGRTVPSHGAESRDVVASMTKRHALSCTVITSVTGWKHSRQQLSYTLSCSFFLICKSTTPHFSQIVAFVPFFYLYVRPFIVSCSFPVRLTNVFCFLSCNPHLDHSILCIAFPPPVPTSKLHELSTFPSPTGPEAVSILPICCPCHDALVKGSILLAVCASAPPAKLRAPSDVRYSMCHLTSSPWHIVRPDRH